MHQSEHLTIGEFSRRMEAFERILTSGIERIEDKVGDHAERIAVLEGAERKTTAKTVGWGSAVAGVVAIAIEAVRQYAK